MPKISVEIQYQEGDLEKAIEFIHGRAEYVPAIVKDYFSEEVIKVDITAIENDDKKRYFLTGFLTSLIVFQDHPKTQMTCVE